MLQDAYKMFSAEASIIPGWETIDKSELVNKFVEFEVSNPYLANAYMGAIICRYWPKIHRFYKTMSFSATHEDVYDLLINSILRAIKARRWLQEDSTIYKDPNGPDKAINRTMMCERLNFLAFRNREKRSLDLSSISIDELEDNSGDAYLYAYDGHIESVAYNNLQISENLKFLYVKKLYLLLFIYYCLSFGLDLFRDGKFNTKACVRVLMSLGEEDFREISELLGVGIDAIQKCYNTSVKYQDRDNLKLNIEFSILKLKELYVRESI